MIDIKKIAENIFPDATITQYGHLFFIDQKSFDPEHNKGDAFLVLEALVANTDFRESKEIFIDNDEFGVGEYSCCDGRHTTFSTQSSKLQQAICKAYLAVINN